jgi:FlaA1/EpsC-like NDP-sugar epimerase
VLVTGAGGSVGAELCRQVLDAGPERLVLLGHGEHSLFLIQRELRDRSAPGVLATVVADIRNAARIDRVIREEQPDVVLHAAAHKHVPLMEENVAEAVTNNVQGTWVLLDALRPFPDATFLLLSTDKAVRPASVMGASKQLAEGLVRVVARRDGRRYAAIRFGNVLGSRGSLVPIVEEQIRRGGPVTLTDPAMRRYFIGPVEAAGVVLRAASIARGGELFVSVMGEVTPIPALVEDIIRAAGKVPGRDIAIEFVGIRPGEKVDEEPFFAPATTDPTGDERLRLARDTVPAEEWLSGLRDLVDAAAREEGEAALRVRLGGLVQGWQGTPG